MKRQKTRPVRRLLYENFQKRESLEFLLFLAPERIDQFRVTVNGKEWKKRIGFTHVLAGLRKAS